ncbi:hypothetical protein AFLA_004170 [Aspergillus flavus NRRL3357]|nr:hypothetical protein AFLA_004170 [Aspergillus flavus NRRL3357]
MIINRHLKTQETKRENQSVTRDYLRKFGAGYFPSKATPSVRGSRPLPYRRKFKPALIYMPSRRRHQSVHPYADRLGNSGVVRV